MGIIAKYKFNQTIYENFIPTFNSGFTYTITDEIDTDGYTIRTIESDDLPTQVRFGNTSTTKTDREQSLLEVYECSIEKVTTMQNMFQNCSSLTFLNFSNFNTEKITNMSYMFNNCSSLTSLLVSNFNTSQVTNMSYIFQNCSSLTSLDVSNFDTSQVTNMDYMFINCSKLTSLDVSNFDTSQVTTMQSMFQNCSSLTILDVSNWNTEKVTNMSSVFRYCSSLTTLNASNWNTEKVTSMNNMFQGCKALKNINLSSWNTSKATIPAMFSNCSSLTELDLSNFSTESTVNFSQLFGGCTNLKTLDISNFVIDESDNTLYMFDNCPSLTNIGLLYSPSVTINRIASTVKNPTTIFYYDANSSQLTTVEGITFKKYIMPSTFQLPPHIQLHSLPDGTRDELDLKTGILTRRIQEIVLNGSETNWAFDTTKTLTQVFRLSIEEDAKYYDGVSLNAHCSNNSYQIKNGTDDKAMILGWGKIYLQTLKTDASTVTELRTYLSQNPITVYYEFATPTTEKLILNYNNSCNYGVILPRGTSDNYNVITNEYKQNLDFIPIDGSIAFDTATIKDTMVKFSVALSKFEVDTTNVRGSDGIYCDNDLFRYEVSDSDYEHAYIENDTTLHIYVSKNRLSSYDQVGFQMYLTNNPFDLYYAMRNTIISYVNYEDLDAEKASWEMLDCTEDGSITIESGNMDKTLLLDCLDYVAPTKNRFEIDLLKANTQYTIYAEGVSGRIQLNFGGNIVNFTSGNIYTSGETQLVEFYTDNEIKNLIIIEGDTRNETIEFFEGLTSSENITVISSNSDENESNKISYEGITLRSLPNGVKDEINVLTGEYIQRVGEVVLNGSEEWRVSSDWETDNVVHMEMDISDLKQGEEVILHNFNYIPFEKAWQGGSVDAIRQECVSTFKKALILLLDRNKIEENTLQHKKDYLSQNPITVQYELAEPIIRQLDPQSLTPYQDGYISMETEVNYPSFIYSLPSTNTFYIPKIKNMTQYTLKYPVGSGTVTIGNIQYNVTSDSMLFTTPIEITGDKNSLVFETDDNPMDIMILEGNYSNREVKYFTGINSVINPMIRVTNSLTGGSVEYKGNSDIALYSLPNKMSDKLDVLTGYLVRVTGIREYQDGDYELDNVFTDGVNTVYKLDSPLLYRNINFPIPVLNGYGTIELDSDEAIPQFNYRTLSSNYYPLELLEPNSTYTMIGEAQANTTFTLGGTYVGNYSGGKAVINLGSVTENSLKFSNDIGLKNFMLVKGDATNSTLPFYTGIKSVEDISFLIKGYDGQENNLVLDDSIVLRECGGVYDSIDLVNYTMTKRLNEIILVGTEYWSVETSKSVDSNYQLFSLAVTSAKDTKNAKIYCDKLTHKYLGNDTDCVYFENNKLYLCINKHTIGGDNINALKVWLTKNNVKIIYPLISDVKLDLDVIWEITPPITYETQTGFDTTVALNSLKPILAVTVATTTLEEIVSTLEAQNAKLEEENIATMLALTGIYETMVVPTIDSEVSTVNLSDGKDGNNMNGMSISPMGMIYAKLVKKGLKTIEQVPAHLQAEVKYVLKEDK